MLILTQDKKHIFNTDAATEICIHDCHVMIRTLSVNNSYTFLGKYKTLAECEDVIRGIFICASRNSNTFEMPEEGDIKWI